MADHVEHNSHKFLKGSGAPVGSKSGVPNGGTDNKSLTLGDPNSREKESEVNATVNKKSNFGTFTKGL